MPILTDYHMHTPLCKHAAGPIEAYVERARQLGLREIGFSDHNPLPNGLGTNVRMDEWQLAEYVTDVLRVRDQYRNEITVRLGLELDYLEPLEDYLQAQVDEYPWDYVIGSVHYLNGECTVGSWSRRPLGDVAAHYARYFALVRQLARSGLCDMIAHFDIPKRSGIPPGEAQRAEISRTLETIQLANLCVEINTSGYRHTELLEPSPYPGFAIVEQMIARDIPIAVNSDAHQPVDVGTAFATVEAFLRDHGCLKLARFAGRRREMVAL